MGTFCSMRLRAWMKAKGVKPSDLQEEIGAKSRMTVYRYMNGDQIPEEPFMGSIVRISEKQVTPNDFYEHYAERQREKIAVQAQDAQPAGAAP